MADAGRTPELQNQNAIVSGAGSGLGKSIAVGLARAVPSVGPG